MFHKMLGKMRVKLILLMTVVNLVFSCLVTNCPRGGKRGNADFKVPSNNVVESKIKMCKLCNPGTEICLGVYTSSKVSCGTDSHCVTQELCCSKRSCKLHSSCESNFKLRKREEFKENSAILSKILKYNL